MDAEIDQAKGVLRAEVRARLLALPPDERQDRSRLLVQRLVESAAWDKAAEILLFAPLVTEPDLDLLWQEGHLAGKEVVYPRVEGMAVRLYYVHALDELEQTRWGLREPPPRGAREAMLDDLDLVLVPGLAFDAAGGRLGRGGGYYDRLLASRDPAKTRLIGVGFAFQLGVEPLPLATHDVRMDDVFTDGGKSF